MLVDLRQDFLVECWPIGDTAVERPRMDEVEAVFAKHPWFSEIVNLETKVWRDQRRLGGAEICSKHLVLSAWTFCHSIVCHTNLGRWMFVRKVTVCLSATRCSCCKGTVLQTSPRYLCLSPNPIHATCTAMVNDNHALLVLPRTIGFCGMGARFSSPSSTSRQMW
jgi:hypothetical protein